MQKIRFHNSDKIFDVTLSAWGNGRMKCVFHSAVDVKKDQFLKSGFKELNENNLKVQGNHSRMRYFYRVVDNNTIIYTAVPDDTYEKSLANKRKADCIKIAKGLKILFSTLFLPYFLHYTILHSQLRVIRG